MPQVGCNSLVLKLMLVSQNLGKNKTFSCPKANFGPLYAHIFSHIKDRGAFIREGAFIIRINKV